MVVRNMDERQTGLFKVLSLQKALILYCIIDKTLRNLKISKYQNVYSRVINSGGQSIILILTNMHITPPFGLLSLYYKMYDETMKAPLFIFTATYITWSENSLQKCISSQLLLINLSASHWRISLSRYIWKPRVTETSEIVRKTWKVPTIHYNIILFECYTFRFIIIWVVYISTTTAANVYLYY